MESWTRSSTVSAGQRERAEIVLAVAGGAGVSGAARSLGVSRPTVIKWRDRFVADGLDGLGDLPRSGRPKTIDDAQIIAATLEAPPVSLAVTHWSTRLLGRHLGVADATVARAWRAYRVQPWRQGTFKFSTDPELAAKVRDVVGLYLDPPRNAVVLCVDEKSQIQALNRTQPILPVRPGLPEKATHDYKRNGTTSLFAALEVATGAVTDRCYDRHGKAEFLDFLKLVAKTYPRRRLHGGCPDRRGTLRAASQGVDSQTVTAGDTSVWVTVGLGRAVRAAWRSTAMTSVARVAVADDSPELLLGDKHPGGGPALAHVAALPALDVTLGVADDLDHRLAGVG